MPQQKPQPTTTPSSYLNSSTRGPSSSSRAHMVVNPPVLQQSIGRKKSRRDTNENTDPDHYARGGSPLPPPRTPLPRTRISETAMRPSLPPRSPLYFLQKKPRPFSQVLNLPWLPRTRGTKHFDDLFSPVAAIHRRRRRPCTSAPTR
jgi:hypothetical protein